MFRRFFDEGLAQSSYVVACSRTRKAAVIDPRRDVAAYVAAARDNGLALTYAIDTHVHADFVSGARELAQLGVRIIAGPGAQLQYAHSEVTDGEVLELGDLRLTCLHTPGHTPEHISIVTQAPGAPQRVFTGDTLFVGAVGRPDLLGDAASRPLAAALHGSLFGTLLRLPDDTEVWPGHGAGSLCGSGIGTADHSTIGAERRHNVLLQHHDRDVFVRAVLDDLPETPPYFPGMKVVNARGAAVLDLAHGVDEPPSIAPRAAADACERGAWLIDLRPADAHGRSHPENSISVPFGPKAGYWAAWVVPPEAPVVLMSAGGPTHTREIVRQLLLVGLDHIVGSVAGGFEGWVAAGLPTAEITQMPAAALAADAAARERLTIVDVRSGTEWRRGHLDGAVHVPLQELEGRAGELRGRTVATLCEGGSRSGLAASILERAGVRPIVNITGGMAAWRAARGEVRQ